MTNEQAIKIILDVILLGEDVEMLLAEDQAVDLAKAINVVDPSRKVSAVPDLGWESREGKNPYYVKQEGVVS